MPRKRHVENWRQWLKDLRVRQNTIDRELPQAVRLARTQGASWREIGELWHISQQAATKRWKHLEEDNHA
ncbi:MAG: hypothetical protein ABWZ55_10260 [Acidimicrobiales bacterium]